MSNRSKIVTKILIFSLLAVFAIVTVSYGWFFKAENEIDAGINGGMVEEYFHCGSGQADDPFVITRPIHYSRMVEFFQRTTNLPVVYNGSGENVLSVKFGTDYIYFQIGVSEAKLFDPSEDDNDAQRYVFEYNDSGELVRDEDGHAQKSLVLNMGGYATMMPIGTSEIPFKGQITGGTGEDNTTNITIKNLNIVGTEDVLIDKEDGTREMVTRTTEDIGVFGCVTDDSRIMNMYLSDVSIDLTETKEDAEKVHVGYIAGHIVSYVNAGSLNYANQTVGTNAIPISNVYVNNSFIRGGASAATECNYGYIGYIELVDGVIASSISSSIGEILDDGSGSEGWGGSINMTALFNRLHTIFSNSNSTTVYPTTEEVTKPDSLKGIPTVTFGNTANVGRNDINGQIRVKTYPLGGNYIGTTTDSFNYIYSLKQNQTTTVTTYTKDGSVVDAYLLLNNGKYLAYRTNLSLEVETYYTSNVNEAAKLIVDGRRWYTIISNSIYYLKLNNTGSVEFANVAPADATDWQINEDDEFYTVINGVNYYLYFSAQDASWLVTRYRDAYQVGDGDGHYLYANNNGISSDGITVGRNAYIWHLSSEVGDTTILYVSEGTTYYLNFNGTELTRQTNSVTWSKDAIGYYVTIANEKFYLVYDNGWTAKPLTYYTIKDGNGNYLNSNNNHEVTSTTNEEESVKWFLSNPNGNTTISTIINGTRYYLNFNNGLVLNTTSATWNKDGNNYYITNGGYNYYLNYNTSSNNWEAILTTYITIGDNDHFIGNNGTTVNPVNNESNATHFHFTGTNSGNLFTFINGTRYYLNYTNNNLVFATTASTTWTYSNNQLKTTSGNYDYYLIYNNGWVMAKLRYYLIKKDSHYLCNNGTSGVTDSTNSNTATHWYFETDGTYPSGRIYTFINGTMYYLYLNNGNLQLNQNNSTSWTNNNGQLYYRGNGYNATTYYLVYDSGWKVQTSNNVTYYIHVGSNYLTNNGTSGVTNATSQDNAISWTFANTGENPSGRITASINGTTYYFRNNKGTLSLSRINSTTWKNENGKLYYTNGNTSYYLRLNGTTWTTTTNSSNATTFTFTEKNNTLSFTALDNIVDIYCDEHTVIVSTIGYTSHNTSPSIVIDNEVYTYESIYEDTTETLYSGVQGTYRRGTYFPLRLALRNENEEESNSNYYSDYRVSKVNTGYIIGGTYSAASSSGQGDIRVSSYAISNINGSYNTTTKNLSVYTFNGSGSAVAVNSSVFEDTESASGKAYARFKEILAQDDDNVYGLHFMDSAILKTKIIQAEAVTIFGNSYVNYDLPESCVDFNVLDKGQVIFFAGDYYNGNKCFFSLHQIFRDENQNIIDIKEIKEIYSTADNLQEDKYVYRFSDGAFSDGVNTYNSLPSGYTSVFNTDWITNPRNGQTMNSKYVYYFEIPCNVGEYALGSVSGKDGGYLLYLDVASNGTQTYTYNKENGVMDAPLFTQTGYRASGATINATLNTSFEIPEGTTKDNFSINVSFDEENLTYNVVIVNQTGNAMEISILLVDDDDNNDNEYLYMYTLTYNGEEIQEVDSGYDIEKEAYVSSSSFTLGGESQG